MGRVLPPGTPSQVDYLDWARADPRAAGSGRRANARSHSGLALEQAGNHARADTYPCAGLFRAGSAGRDGRLWPLECGQLERRRPGLRHEIGL